MIGEEVFWHAGICHNSHFVSTGFKEGFSFANKPCRVYEITSNSLSVHHKKKTVKLRNEQEHRHRCDILELLSSLSEAYCSKKYGVNQHTFLHDIHAF